MAMGSDCMPSLLAMGQELVAINSRDRDDVSFSDSEPHKDSLPGRATPLGPTSFPKGLHALLKMIEGNSACVDCGSREDDDGLEGGAAGRPVWASVTYGTLLCGKCAFLHMQERKDSAPISLENGDWDLSKILALLEGGNANFLRHVKPKPGKTTGLVRTKTKKVLKSVTSVRTFIVHNDASHCSTKKRDFYETKAAALYKKKLAKKVLVACGTYGSDKGRPETVSLVGSLAASASVSSASRDRSDMASTDSQSKNNHSAPSLNDHSGVEVRAEIVTCSSHDTGSSYNKPQHYDLELAGPFTERQPCLGLNTLSHSSERFATRSHISNTEVPLARASSWGHSHQKPSTQAGPNKKVLQPISERRPKRAVDGYFNIKQPQPSVLSEPIHRKLREPQPVFSTHLHNLFMSPQQQMRPGMQLRNIVSETSLMSGWSHPSSRILDAHHQRGINPSSRSLDAHNQRGINPSSRSLDAHHQRGIHPSLRSFDAHNQRGHRGQWNLHQKMSKSSSTLRTKDAPSRAYLNHLWKNSSLASDVCSARTFGVLSHDALTK